MTFSNNLLKTKLKTITKLLAIYHVMHKAKRFCKIYVLEFSSISALQYVNTSLNIFSFENSIAALGPISVLFNKMISLTQTVY